MNLNKVVCAISGGVDSALAASLVVSKAKKVGFQVCGAFMKNWDTSEELGYCSQDNDLQDAKFVADKLNIELHEVNFEKEYWTHVFQSFLQAYQIGTTINPDVLCNKVIKFDHFFNYAKNTLKADAISTGHYASTSFGLFLEKYDQNQKCKLLVPQDLRKDQTLFLSNIPEKALRRTLFPLGDRIKPEVRAMANELGFEKMAERRESMGLCFIGKRDFSDFIDQYISPVPGEIIDLDSGKNIGDHNGIHHFTRGQNLRLGDGPPGPHFVSQFDVNKNIVYAVNDSHHPSLYSDQVELRDFHWIEGESPIDLCSGMQLLYRLQSQAPLEECAIDRILFDGSIKVTLKYPVRAVTCGQSFAIYKDRICLGSGIVNRTQPHKFNTNLIIPVQQNINTASH